MATGDPAVQIVKAMPVATNSATPDIRTGGNTTSAEQVPVQTFLGASTDNHLDFLCFLRGYGGGGLTFTIVWSADTATSCDVVWELAISKFTHQSEDLDTDHTYDFNNTATDGDTTAGSVNQVTYSTIAFASGADMDSLANGQAFILRLQRNAADTTNDNMAGAALLWLVEGRET